LALASVLLTGCALMLRSFAALLRIPLRIGRDFTEQDDENALGVAIISESLANRYWPNESRIGRRLSLLGDWLTIVGGCGDIKDDALNEPLAGTIYVHHPRLSLEVMQFVARRSD
jgi:putative ABC transport system permease protein